MNYTLNQSPTIQIHFNGTKMEGCMGKFFILILATFMLIGCSGSKLEKGIPEQSFNVPEYKIGPGDTLYINVWQNPDLSLSVPVRPDGRISVPLVGDADAVGLTAEKLAAQLSEQLSKFIRSPEVTVIVTSPISAEFFTRVRITGAVQSPQSTQYRQGMTVLDILLQAGGLTAFASGNNAVLYRKTDSGTKQYPIKLNSIIKQGDISTNYELHPSDILIVPESIF